MGTFRVYQKDSTVWIHNVDLNTTSYIGLQNFSFEIDDATETIQLIDSGLESKVDSMNLSQIVNEFDVPFGTITDVANYLSAFKLVSSIDISTVGINRTAGLIRPTTAGNVNTLKSIFYSVSVANVGTADGTVLGIVIKPNEVLNWNADALNNYFESFDYDATGTEFLITYIY